MTNLNPIASGSVLIALDIAKVRNVVLIEAPGRRKRGLNVLNDRMGP